MCSICWSSCGAAPTTPDDSIATRRPGDLIFTDWQFGFGDRITSVRVRALYPARIGLDSRDVTADATWTSTAPGIVLILEPGRMSAVSPGDAEVTVSFGGTSVTRLLRVFPGEPPLTVIRSEDRRLLGGGVRDVTLSVGPQPGISSAMVEILSGHNAGRSTLTDAYARYEFKPPFICGPGTVRATKSGYRDEINTSVLCELMMPSFGLMPVE